MKKFLLALSATLVLCVSVFADSTPSFQQSVTFTNTFNGYEYSVYTTDNAYIYCVFANSDSNRAYVQCIGDEPFSYYYDGGGSYSVSVEINSSGYYGDRIGTSLISDISPSYSIFPYGTSDADIVSAFSEFLESQNAPGVQSSFTVPCGNVLYFQVLSEQDVTFSAQMPQLSYLVQFGNNAYGPWGDTGIEYGPAASLPSSGTTFPILSMDPVQWAKGEPKNILGQSKVGVATKHCLVGQWYSLFCPLTSPQVLDASNGDHAMGASVVVSGSFSQIKVYPLSETLDYDNPLGATYESGSNDGYDSYFDGSSDENGTVTWTNQDGQVQAPQSGGTNYVSPAANAESLLSQIRQLLANIVSELKSLFTFGYEAVQDLVGIMRDFVNVLGGLYTWLPAEVYSALMSAVIVAIVIGVFKVFL